ncbi:MAG: hypothetical protein O6952_10400, partial [Planctomycetota bacterium]|nr:hypothetical protein [Planctomycetota bacterium]
MFSKLGSACLPILALAGIPFTAEPDHSTWEVEMRDGSVLHARIERQSIVLVNDRGPQRIPIEDVKEIWFADRFEPGLRARMQGLIGGLGDADFHVRERSSEKLEALGGAALAEIRAARANDDPEVRYRAGILLTRLEAKGAVEISMMDGIRTAEGIQEGLIQSSFMTVEVAGRRIELSGVHAIRISRRSSPSDVVSVYVPSGAEFIDTG